MGSNHFSIRVVIYFFILWPTISPDPTTNSETLILFFKNSFKGIRLFFEGNSSNKENQPQRLAKGVSRILG